MSVSHRFDALFRRVAEVVLRAAKARMGTRSKRMERLLLMVAIALFVGGFVLAYINLPESIREPVWALLVAVALIGVPLTVATNAAEYALSANMLGYRVPVESALKVSIVAAAANLLPIPGAVLVRTEAIRRLGAKTKRALATSALVGVAWLAVTAVLTGALLLLYGRVPLGAIAVCIGLVLSGAAFYLLTRIDVSRPLAVGAKLVVVETASVMVKAVRLYVILRALHHQVGLDQAMALTSAGVVATASGFFPGGLGATEVLSAAVSPLVSLPAAVGLLASAIDRMIGLAVLALLTGALMLRKGEVAREVEVLESSDALEGRPEPKI